MSDELPEAETEENETPGVKSGPTWWEMQDAIQGVLVKADEGTGDDATWFVANFWLTVECVSVTGEKFLQHVYPPEESFWSHMGLVAAATQAIKDYRAGRHEFYDEDDDDTSNA